MSYEVIGVKSVEVSWQLAATGERAEGELWRVPEWN
jgi:hypothetical protein